MVRIIFGNNSTQSRTIMNNKKFTKKIEEETTYLLNQSSDTK